MILLQISGRVGGDAEAVKVNDQWAIRFSVCHSYSYADANGQRKEISTWVRCTMWKKNDKMAQYIRKGDVVYCAGVPKAHGWQDNDRKIRAQLELTVNDFDFVYSKRDGDSSNPGTVDQPANQITGQPTNQVTGQPTNQVTNQQPANLDDLPF